MNTTQVHRRTSLRAVLAVVVLGVTLLSPGVALAAPQPATVTDAQLTEAEWLRWLAEHPELEGLTAAGTGAAVATGTVVAAESPAIPAALAAGGGALEAGAFVGGVWIGYELNKHVLHWTFGSSGDNRTALSAPAHSGDCYQVFANYWRWNCYGGKYTPPPPASYILGDWATLNANPGLQEWSGAGHTVDVVAQCEDNSTHAIRSINQPVSLDAYGTVNPDMCTAQEFPILRRFDEVTSTGNVTLYAWWTDPHPNALLTVTPHATCINADGLASTQTGDPLPILPGADLTASVDLPDCPVGSRLGVGYVTGGRATDDPVGVLVAAPSSRTTGTTTTTAPQPSASPSLGSGTGTNPGSDPAGDPSATPHSGASCMGAAWSWNPLNWVYVPVKCALIWAFVPDPTAVQADFTSLTDAWGTTPMGVWADGLGSLVAPLGGFVGAAEGPCAGPTFTFHFIDWVFQPFSACAGLPQRASQLVLPIEAFAVYGGGFFLCLRMIGSTIGLKTPEDA